MSAVYRNLGGGANSAQPPRLLDRMRQVLRTEHYAYSIEQAYVGWVRRFILFHDKLKWFFFTSSEVETSLKPTMKMPRRG